jgi:hypothetical protein
MICWHANGKKMFSFFMVLVLLGVAIAIQTRSMAVAADAPLSVKEINEQLLAGRWLRPDGGYILELSEIKPDGSLKAAYFNPRSINISRAEWSRSEGKINIFVELRDVNYPGSQYTLRYDPASDRLTGNYFQAALKENFEVEFVRTE